MTESELDVLWQRALHESVRAGEQFTRYRFAALVRAQVLLEMKSDSVHPATADAGASTAPPSAWQPIETVPRTGLSVLAVCAKYGSVFLAHWANGLVDSSVHDDEGYRDRAAIAWMPLPRWGGDMEGRRNG